MRWPSVNAYAGQVVMRGVAKCDAYLQKDHKIQISMNGKGRTIDNILIERFFRTLKQSNIYISDYQTIKELKEGVRAYIYKYNFKRFHSSLNYQKPMNIYLEFIEKSA